MSKFTLMGLVICGYYAAVSFERVVIAQELGHIQLLYTAAQTQATAISASNR